MSLTSLVTGIVWGSTAAIGSWIAINKGAYENIVPNSDNILQAIGLYCMTLVAMEAIPAAVAGIAGYSTSEKIESRSH